MEKIKEKLEKIEPEKILNKILLWFDSKKRLAFLIALIVGIITHITMITDTIMSQDGLWNSMEYYRPGDWETSLGRWGIELVERLNFFIAIPTVSTISCILLMAISAVFIIDVFELKNKVSIIFTSLIVVLTPTLTATLLYIYSAFAYCFNFLITVLAIWFIYKFKYKKTGLVLATILFMFSLSIYQSYIGVSIGLCIMISIIELIKSNKSIKEILINIGKTILVVAIGVFIYYVLTNIILNISGLELNYRNEESTFSVIEIIKNLGTSIIKTYKDFFMFFLGNDIIFNANYRRELFSGAFLILLGIISLVAILSINPKEKKERILRIILSILFIIVIPIGLNFIDIIALGNEMYALTAVQMILIIPFAFAMFESINKCIIFKWMAILCCLYMLGTYYIADNTSYTALKMTYNQAYSTTVRLLDRIENTNGYRKEYPMVFGGIIGNDNYPRTSDLYQYTIGSVVNNTVFHGSYSGAIGTWVKFVKIFFGIDVEVCTPEIYYQIVTSETYKNMQVFPAQDSIRIENGIVIIKLSETPYLPY